MKGRYKGKILMAMGMAVMLGGCGERAGQEQPGMPEKEPAGEKDGDILPDSDLLLEGLEDHSGIFAAEMVDTVLGAEHEGKTEEKEPADTCSEESAASGIEDGKNEAADIADVDAEQTPERITGTPEKRLLTAEFTTYYGSSSTARCSNIEHAADLLNGVIIEPGEVFSCSGTIGPVTEENGYQPAGTYVEGKIQEGIGGGVCQVSSTLYNAALLAGLTIVERSAHSMVVSYVEPGRDAAIAGDYKDLKLRNDFEYPVMLEAEAADGNLRVVIHTAEEDNGTVVSLVSIIVSKTEPGEPVITVDESQPEDYYQVTQKSHTGYVAELYRVVSRNGVEILKEKVNTSTYEAVPEYATVGGKETRTEE